MNAGDVIFKFKGDDSQLNTTKNNIASGMGKLGVGIAKGFAVATTAVMGATTAVMGFGVKFNNEIEQYTTSFGTMLGSADKANEFVSTLKSMASKTPFELGDLAKSSQTLLAFGMSAEETTKYLQVLGDISQGDKDKLNSLSLSFAQMSSTGKLTGQDLLQMVNAGFNPLQQISEKTGKSIGQLKEEMADGAISAEMVQQAFVEATSEGGRFYGAMEAQSKTFNGQVSTLKDNAKSLAGALSGGLTNALKGGVLPAVNEMVQGLQTAFETGGIDAFASKLGESLVKGLTMITNALPQVMQVAVKVLQAFLTALVQNAPMIIQNIMQMLPILITGFLNMLPQLLQTAITIAIQVITGLADMLPVLIPQIIDAILAMIPILIDNLPLFIEAGFKLLIGLAVGLIKAVPTLLSYIPKIIGSMLGYWKQLPSMLFNIGIDMVKGLWNGIKDVTGWVLDKIKGFGKSILNGIKGIFGIHSPSTEFAFVGKMNAEGLIKGMAGMEDEVQQSFDGMFNLSPQLYGASSMNMSPKVNVVVNNNMKQDPLGQMVNDIKSFGGGSKNDYNYGYGGA